jgi:hypothetical protein
MVSNFRYKEPMNIIVKFTPIRFTEPGMELDDKKVFCEFRDGWLLLPYRPGYVGPSPKPKFFIPSVHRALDAVFLVPNVSHRDIHVDEKGVPFMIRKSDGKLSEIVTVYPGGQWRHSEAEGWMAPPTLKRVFLDWAARMGYAEPRP